MTTSIDISVVLSGGTNNSSPEASIGGDPSAAALVSGSLNNLFDDITPDQSDEGYEDYRCIYVFNESEDTVYNVNMWLTDTVDGGSELELGIQDLDEVQRISITGTPTGGSFTLSFSGVQFTSSYNSDLAAWGQALENTLNELNTVQDDALLRNVSVLAQTGSSTTIFDVSFLEQDGKRAQPSFVIVSNDLTPSVTLSLSTVATGSPINTVASELDVSTTPPGGVNFFVPSEQSPIYIPKLNSGDGFPLWIKRSVAAGTESVNADGGTVRITMETLNPLG